MDNGLDFLTLALAKSYTDETIKGAGGLKGDDGDSAYQVAVKNGFEGTEKEWLESLKANVQTIVYVSSTAQAEMYDVNVAIKDAIDEVLKADAKEGALISLMQPFNNGDTMLYGSGYVLDHGDEVWSGSIVFSVKTPITSINFVGTYDFQYIYSTNQLAIEKTMNDEDLKIYDRTVQDKLDPIVTDVDTLEEGVSKLNDGLSDLAYGNEAGGKNLINYSGDGNTTVFYPLNGKVGDKFTIYVWDEGSTSSQFNYHFKNSSGESTGDAKLLSASEKSKILTITLSQNITGIGFYDVGTHRTNVKIMVVKGENTSLSYEPYIMSNKQLGTLNNTLSDLEFLGWEVPSEFSVKNSFDGKVFTQRVGRVDLGSLTWGNYKSGGFSTNINAISNIKVPANNVKANAYIYGYETKTAQDTLVNHQISLGASYLYIVNTSFTTDATAFKTAMNGIYLYYELATPITYNVGSEAVERVNESLNEQGLLNKFDGLWSQGGAPGNTSAFDIYTTTPIPVSVGDRVTAYYDGSVNSLRLQMYNGNTFVSNQVVNTNKFDFVIPSGVTQVYINVAQSTAFTPNMAKKISVYVNNEIDKVKADLSNVHTTDNVSYVKVGRLVTATFYLTATTTNNPLPVPLYDNVPCPVRDNSNGSFAHAFITNTGNISSYNGGWTSGHTYVGTISYISRN